MSIGSMLLVPIARIQELPAPGKALAAVAGFAAWLWGDAFRAVCGLLLLANLYDWLLGRGRAVAEDRFDADRSRAGWASKGTGLVQALLLRGAEGWAADHLLVSTAGWLATAFVAALLMAELDSINRQRLAMGGPPVPGWDQALDLLRRAIDRATGGRAGREHSDAEPPR